MKPRPRQIDLNKIFTCVDSVEKFLQEEGVDQDAPTQLSILTPDMINAVIQQKLQEGVVQQAIQISKKVAQPQQLYEYKNPIYNRYCMDAYPNGLKYELNEIDYQFLLDFNNRIKIKQNQQDVKGEDLEQFFEELDKRSSKEIIVGFNEFRHDLRGPLPQTINRLDESLQQELYNHWKKNREDQQRPLLRALIHPELEDQNPHLAFRCRDLPADRTMKLRRVNQQQQKGLQDMETLSSRVISLKEEMNHAEQLLKMILVRDQGFEIYRRIQFAQWYRNYRKELSEQQQNPNSLGQFSQKCFMKGNNINEDQYDHLDKQANQWHKQYESCQMEQEQLDEQFKNFQHNLRSISTQHHMSVSNTQVQESEPFYSPIAPSVPQRPAPVRPPREALREKSYQNKEYVEERRDSVARFLTTFYLEARKLHLPFDKVINNPMSLLNYQPPIQSINKTTNQMCSVSTNSSTFVHPEISIAVQPREVVVQSQPQRKAPLIGFFPMKRYRSNLILRMPIQSEWVPNFEEFDRLNKQEELKGNMNQQYFIKKKQNIIELSTIDGYNNDIFDDENNDEELMKNIRKRVKTNQNKSQQQQTISQQQIQVK